MKDRKTKLIFSMFLLMVISIITALILKLFGINWFDYSVNEKLSSIKILNYKWFQYIISYLLLMFNTFLIFGYSTKTEPKETVKKYIIPVLLVLPFVFIPSQYRFLSSVVYVPLIILIVSKRFKNLLWFLLISSISVMYQFLLIWLKIGILPTEINYEFTFFQQFIFCIDLYIFITLLYLIRLKGGFNMSWFWIGKPSRKIFDKIMKFLGA